VTIVSLIAKVSGSNARSIAGVAFDGDGGLIRRGALELSRISVLAR